MSFTKNMLKNIINNIANSVGLEVLNSQRYQRLSQSELELEQLLGALKLASFNQQLSMSQLKQDLIVLLMTGFKKNGFYVEFGATDGIQFSNTYLLEKVYGWEGILAEPARVWQKDLSLNRKAAIDHACVWGKSGEKLQFNMVDQPELSTIAEFNQSDHLSVNRENGVVYEVETISLNDLLLKHNAPEHIDYLSIDTEGSEYDVLEAFDFSKHSISIITCEHNFTDNRGKIFKLLQKHGYERKFESLSKWDDWYFKESVIDD